MAVVNVNVCVSRDSGKRVNLNRLCCNIWATGLACWPCPVGYNIIWPGYKKNVQKSLYEVIPKSPNLKIRERVHPQTMSQGYWIAMRSI
jgi:hypothetical protein